MCPPRGIAVEWEAIRQAFRSRRLPLCQHEWDFDTLLCVRCCLRRKDYEGIVVPSPSDTGIAGALPLPPIEWMPGAPIGDAEWSAQNRKINDLLAGRTT